MSHVLQDLRHSVRLLRRTPGFTSAAVLVLALGIGANTAVFSLVNALILQPRAGRIDQLVGVFSRDRVKVDRYRDFSYPAYLDLRDRPGVFESLMAHTFSIVGIGEGQATKQAFVSLVSANYFKTLGVSLAAGRAFTLDEERPGSRPVVTIASYAAWRKAGLAPEFLGSTVRVNGTEFTVIGVAPRGFGGTMSLVSPQWFFPIGAYDTVVANEMFKQGSGDLRDRANYSMNLAGMLKPGMTRAAAEQGLDTLAKQLDAEYAVTDHERTIVLAGLPRMGVSSSPQGDGPVAAFSGLLMAMAALVLIVACLNLANLLLARGAARRREIAIRQALGSGRRRIVQQLLVEGFVLSLMGAACGVVVGWWATGALSAWLASALPLGIDVVVEPSWRMLPAAVGFAIFSTVAFALGPSWSLSRQAVAADLKEERGSERRRFVTGSLLVVSQVAVSLALVAAGGLFVRAALRAAQADPGFSLDHQLMVSLDPSMASFDRTRTKSVYQTVLERVRSIPGVERASFASIVPFGEFREGRLIRLLPGTDGVSADFLIVGADYFATVGLPLLRGREFSAFEGDPGGDLSGVIPVVIDRILSKRLFADADPLGRQLLIEARDGDQAKPFVVVGVAGEMRHDLFDTEPKGHVFAPFAGVFRASMTLHIRTAPAADATTLLATVVREVQRIDGRLPIVAARTMIEHRDRSLTEWSVRAAATIFSSFGALALLLATIGVYGLKAYDVSRRTREIGIRMALGATAANVQGLVLREGMRTTAIGLAVGLLMAAGLGKLVSGLLYQVSPFDPLVFFAAAFTLSTAATLACYFPARRATRVVPLEALRSE